VVTLVLPGVAPSAASHGSPLVMQSLIAAARPSMKLDALMVKPYGPAPTSENRPP